MYAVKSNGLVANEMKRLQNMIKRFQDDFSKVGLEDKQEDLEQLKTKVEPEKAETSDPK